MNPLDVATFIFGALAIFIVASAITGIIGTTLWIFWSVVTDPNVGPSRYLRDVEQYRAQARDIRSNIRSRYAHNRSHSRKGSIRD